MMNENKHFKMLEGQKITDTKANPNEYLNFIVNSNLEIK